MKINKLNKKAQSTGIPAISIAFMTAVFIFLVGMGVMNLIKPEVNVSKNTDNLNCNSLTISDGTKVTCLIVDVVIPYFIITIIAASGGVITARLLI